MRWIFFLLLACNAGMFMWFQQRQVADGARLELPDTRPPVQSAGASSLKLLSELESEQAKALGEQGRRCFLLGGFPQQERARQLEQRLLSLDIRVRVAVTDQVQGVDYWVYIPPLTSRQAALRELRELQARNIDSYLITEGELTDGILLGTFTTSDSALSMADRVRLAGFEPRMKDLPRSYQEYWVQVDEQSRRLVDESLLAKLSGDFSELKHQLISCSGVAYR